MDQRVEARWVLGDGYSSSRPPLPTGDFCQNGSENVLFGFNKRPRAFKGLTALSPTTGGRLLFNFDDTYCALLDNGSTAKGSISMMAAGKALGYIGSGHVYRTGATLSVDASTTPQMLLLLSGVYNGGPYQFGLSQPDAPDFAIGTYGAGGQVTGQPPLTGKLKGTYSVVITKVRSMTGAESLPSITSAVITASAQGQFSRITFPAIGGNGADRWGIYVTQAGFGSIGPQLFYIEVLESDVTANRSTVATLAATTPMVTLTTGAFTANDVGRQIAATGGTGLSYTGYITNVISGTTADVAVAPSAGIGKTAVITQAVDGVLRSIPLEWIDADLVGGTLPPIDNDAPQPGWFMFSLQDVTAIVGSYGDQTTGVVGSPGNVIQVSRPGFPEAFPADTHLFLPETPVAVQERAADNYAFIWGQNSLCACTYTGGANPLDLQLVWNNLGIAAPHNACIVDGRVYAMTGTGLVRMGADGQPEREWAVDVARDMEGLTPSTFVLAYDANSRHVIVASGSLQWAFNTITEKWSTKLNMATLVSAVAGNAVAAVTLSGSAKISYLNSTTFTIYTWDSGSGSTWKIFTSWGDGGSPDYKTPMTLRGEFSHDNAGSNISFALYSTDRLGQFNLTTARRSWVQYVPNAGTVMIKPAKKNITGARAFVVYESGTSAGGDSGPVTLEIAGTVSQMRV